MEKMSIERLVEIEREREETMMDKKFQTWMKRLNVSRMHFDRSGIIRAQELMNQYDLSKYKVIINTK